MIHFCTSVLDSRMVMKPIKQPATLIAKDQFAQMNVDTNNAVDQSNNNNNGMIVEEAPVEDGKAEATEAQHQEAVIEGPTTRSVAEILEISIAQYANCCTYKCSDNDDSSDGSKSSQLVMERTVLVMFNSIIVFLSKRSVDSLVLYTSSNNFSNTVTVSLKVQCDVLVQVLPKVLINTGNVCSCHSLPTVISATASTSNNGSTNVMCSKTMKKLDYCDLKKMAVMGHYSLPIDMNSKQQVLSFNINNISDMNSGSNGTSITPKKLPYFEIVKRINLNSLSETMVYGTVRYFQL